MPMETILIAITLPPDDLAVFIDACAAIAARPDFVGAAVSHFLVDVAEDLRAEIQMLAIGFAAFAAAIVLSARIQFAVLADVLGAARARRMDVGKVPACRAFARYAFVGSIVDHFCLSRFRASRLLSTSPGMLDGQA